MELNLVRQEKYSRGQLLLRTFFGWLYIGIPHMFVLWILSVGAAFIGFIAWWIILFTGKYPRDMFEFRVKLLRYQLRVNARILNMLDGYPAFGLSATDPGVQFEVQYPENMSRGKLLLRTFFGIWYIAIPHLICLYFRLIGAYFVMIWAWFAILFTGQYPEAAHNYMVGTLRWSARVGLSLANLTDKYPPFHGRPEWN
jgi:hypothetical protein